MWRRLQAFQPLCGEDVSTWDLKSRPALLLKDAEVIHTGYHTHTCRAFSLLMWTMIRPASCGSCSSIGRPEREGGRGARNGEGTRVGKREVHRSLLCVP